MAYVRIRPRRSTKNQWEYANPILSEGELAFEVPDTGVGTGLVNIKMGDGVTAWNALPYAFNGEKSNTKVTDLEALIENFKKTIIDIKGVVRKVEIQTANSRRIDIQLNEPNDDKMVLGQIWIASDIVSGKIVLNANVLQLNVGDTYRLVATNTLSAYDTIVWETSDSSIIELKEHTNFDCNIHANGRGIAIIKITAKRDGSVLYSETCKVESLLSGTVQILPDNMRIIAGNTSKVTLKNTISTFDSIDWISSAMTFANITTSSNTGATIMGYKSGGATIFARVRLDGNIISSAKCVVTVVGIAFNKEAVNIIVGGTDNVAISNTMVLNQDYDNITWESTANNVVSISSSTLTNVNLVGVAAGNAVIICRAKYNGADVQVAKIPVIVNGTLGLSESLKTINVGATFSLTTTNTLASAEYDSIKWTTSDKTIARITTNEENSAIIEGMGPGTVIITVSAILGVKVIDTATCTVTVNGTLTMKKTEETMEIGSTIQLQAINTLSSNAFKTIKWKSNATDIVEVTTMSGVTCQITAKAAGSATITVEAIDEDDIAIDSDICVVTVNG